MRRLLLLSFILAGCVPGVAVDNAEQAYTDPHLPCNGATPSNAVDTWEADNICRRFVSQQDIDTLDAWYDPFTRAVAGQGAFVWICEQTTQQPPYAWGGPGVPGPSYFPCWKSGTTSHFVRLLPAQSNNNLLATLPHGQASIKVTTTWLPDPPLCPYMQGTPSATQPEFPVMLNVSADDGWPAATATDRFGQHVTGLWPDGSTGAPCLGRFGVGGTQPVVYYYANPF